MKIVYSCPRLSLRNDPTRKQADRHRCAIANWNARGKIKRDSYSIFRRESYKTNNRNGAFEKFSRVEVSAERFVNNHSLYAVRVVWNDVVRRQSTINFFFFKVLSRVNLRLILYSMETIASNYAQLETSQPGIKYFSTFYQSTNDICFPFSLMGNECGRLELFFHSSTYTYTIYIWALLVTFRHFHSLSVCLMHAINIIPLSIVDYPLCEIKFPNSWI